MMKTDKQISYFIDTVYLSSGIRNIDGCYACDEIETLNEEMKTRCSIKHSFGFRLFFLSNKGKSLELMAY